MLAEISQAVAALTPQSAGEVWQKTWPISQAAYDPQKLLFLRPKFIADTCRILGMSADVRDALLRALSLFEEHPALKRLAWHCHFLMFQTPQDDLRFAEWPKASRERGEPASLFYAFIILSGVPALWKQHQDRGIPESITLDTLSDIELWIKEHRHRHGIFGLQEFSWLFHHLSGRLVKLGRLQFCFESWAYDFHAFRHRTTRQVLLLAGHGLGFRKDGQFADADGTTASPDWISVFDASRPGIVRGHPIAPEGQGLPQATSLQRVLVRHVKAGGCWRSGGCVVFPEDMDWDAQVYRNSRRAELPDTPA